MDAGLIWPCLYLTITLFGSLEAMQANLAELNERRKIVLDAAERDPCCRYGLFFTYSQEMKDTARFECLKAWVAFHGLTDPEKVSCFNAQDPKCRSTGAQPYGCSNLRFRCTVVCDVQLEEYRPIGDPMGPLERVTITVAREKTLLAISATVLDPPTPPGGQPRNRRRRPSLTQSNIHRRK